jgi:hypothetical protein
MRLIWLVGDVELAERGTRMETTNQPEWDYSSVGLLQLGLVWPGFFLFLFSCLVWRPVQAAMYLNLVAAQCSQIGKALKQQVDHWTIMCGVQR